VDELGIFVEKNKDFEQLFSEYTYISPRGNVYLFSLGLWHWSKKQNLDFVKTALEYLEINQPYDELRQNKFIDSTAKGREVFGEDLQLDAIYFCEFYKIPRFGKTRVGQLLLHSKLTENKKYIQIICDEFAPKILEFAKEFDCVCFVPPSKDRQVQFMTILDQTINSNKSRVKAYKHFEDMVIQQKTIGSRQDRIESARETIFIDTTAKFESCLIIDDAIASGSTLNEIARKLRTQNIVSGKIVGLGIVGNLNDSKKGYDVISEV
jgi:hypothetical protein